MHSLRYAYRDRRARKGEFRRLWIVRINAACREHDISYSRFIAGLKAAEVDVDRKILADLAVREPAAFGALVDDRTRGPSTPPEQVRRPRREIKRAAGAAARPRARATTKACSCAKARASSRPRSTTASSCSRCYVGVDATRRRWSRSRRAVAAPACRVRGLDDVRRAPVGDTVTPQPVFAVARDAPRRRSSALDGADLALVATAARRSRQRGHAHAQRGGGGRGR